MTAATPGRAVRRTIASQDEATLEANASPLDILLELSRAEDTFRHAELSYLVHRESGAVDRASLLWDEELDDDLGALGRPDAERRQRFGERLRALLGAAEWGAREAEIAAVLEAGRRVHVTLRSSAAELYRLPWELLTLKATGQHLGELPGCLIRYEWPSTETAAPKPDPPPEGGRILFAWSAAGGAVPAAEHLTALRRACTEGHHPFDAQRDVLANVSLERLHDALAAPGAPVAVLHLLCHGGRLESESEGYGLVWSANAEGKPAVVDASALRRVLEPHKHALRLVVLSACYGGNAGAPGNALGSVAQELHRLGIPAVIASREPLSVPGSITLTETLYRRLLVDLGSLEDAFLASRDRLMLDASSGDWASVQLYARAADGPDHRPFVARPYRGLLAFHEPHARYFFGRRDEIDEAVSDLSKLVATSKYRFLIVTGASGTGKSSLVFAGVIPAWQARYPGAWRVVFMRPRDGLARVESALATCGTAQVLLVVDQFEEIFTDIPDKGTREAFVRRLCALSGDPASGLSVIATLRVDFLGRCGEIALEERDSYLDRVAYHEAHRVFVHRMTGEALREVIERPAARLGLALDEGLVDQMLKDAGDEPGALPLVEYTLDQMWQVRVRQGGRYRLTWGAYNALGGVAGALAKKADAIVGGLDEVRRRAARRLLAQLVDTREDAHLDTRRRVRKDKLRLGPEAEAAVFGEVLETLARERLLVLSQEEGTAKVSPIVEIAHEQLVRSWGTLRGWLNEDRQRLADMEPLRVWLEAGRGSPTYVLVGDQLAQAATLLGKYRHEFDAPERALYERSMRRERRRVLRTDLLRMALMAGAAALAGLSIFALLQTSQVNMEHDRTTVMDRYIGLEYSSKQDAIDLTNEILFDVDDKLGPLASAAQARKDLLEKASKLHEKLAGEEALKVVQQETSGVIQQIEARAEQRTRRRGRREIKASRGQWADYLVGGDELRARGLLVEAEKEYRLAVDIAERLVKREPGDVERLRELALSYERLGDVADVGVQPAGAAARASFEKALTLGSVLAESQPKSVPRGLDLARLHVKIGEVAVAAKDSAAAREHRAAAKDILDRLEHAGLAKDDAELLRLRAVLDKSGR